MKNKAEMFILWLMLSVTAGACLMLGWFAWRAIPEVWGLLQQHPEIGVGLFVSGAAGAAGTWYIARLP